MNYKPSASGHYDLLSSLWWELISMSVHAAYKLPPWFTDRHTNTHTDRQLLTSYTICSASWA